MYDDYKAKNAAYSRKYRAKQRRKIEAEDLSKKNEVLEEKRRKDRLRKQKSRNKAVERLTPANQRSPGGYSRISSLSRAVNVVKNAYTF